MLIATTLLSILPLIEYHETEPEVHEGPIPTWVGRPRILPDRVIVPFRIGSHEISAYSHDPHVLLVPKWLNRKWGTRDGWQLDMRLEIDSKYRVEYTTEDAYLVGQMAASWWPPAHDWRWWPEPDEVGTDGDGYFRVQGALQVPGGVHPLSDLTHYVPIAYVLNDDGVNPYTPFDGELDFGGTSGGTYHHHFDTGLVEGAHVPEDKMLKTTRLLVDTEAKACWTVRVAGSLTVKLQSHLVIHGQFIRKRK